ncbi:hypothetical protein [Nocardioides sp. LHG3406-4]|uniref:hypothetical protein n=1 Tax=Nocardioides sp. LHG3406-4 TaxID=2804575 RepID=UPI003CFAEA05
MTVRALALALVATLALAGCSGGGDESVEPRSLSSSTPASVATSSGTAASGATTTAAGTVLALGETGTVAWQVDARTQATADVTVVKVQRRGPSVLSGWVPEDQVADTTPYFVRGSVVNAGETELGGAALPLYLRDASGVLTPAVTFGSDYPRCPSTPLPDPFAPGDTVDICLVYTLAPGADPDAMTFQPTSTDLGVTWQVG